MWIENPRVQARERVDVPVAHRKQNARHAAHVETQHTESIAVHERQLPRSCNRELEVSDLSLEVLRIESYRRGVGPDEWRGHDDEAASGEEFSQSRKRERRFVVEPLADCDLRKPTGRGLGVLGRQHGPLKQRFERCRVQ